MEFIGIKLPEIQIKQSLKPLISASSTGSKTRFTQPDFR